MTQETYASVGKEEIINRCGGAVAVAKSPYAIERIKFVIYELVSMKQHDYPTSIVLYPEPEDVIKWAKIIIGE